MKYEIKDNKTGKTVVVEGNRAPTQTDAESIFQKAGLRQTASSTEAPKKSNGALDTVLRVLNIPSDFLGGAVKASREELTGNYKSPEVGPTFNLGQDENFNLGKLIHPALVGGVRGLKDQTPIMQEIPNTLGIDPESLPGMMVGLAAEVATPDPLDFIKFGKVAGKVTEKIGRKVTKGGEDLVLKGLKPSPSQQKKFLEKTGETLSSWMSKNKITSNFVENVDKKIDEIQGAFDDIALNKELKVDPNTLLEKFVKSTEDFSGSVVGSVKNKAKEIESVYDNIVAKYGDTISLADLTNERKAIDKMLKEGQFGLPMEQASYLRSVRNAIQETIQDVTKDIKYQGKNLKDLGQELKKLYEFEKIALSQSGVGKGTMAFGLTDLLAGGAGFMSGGDPLERLKNAVIAVGTKRLINSPKVIGKTSEGLQKVGDFLQTPAITKTLEALLRIGKEAGIQLPR